DNGAEEDEMCQPPARQLRSTSRPVKCKVASASKKQEHFNQASLQTVWSLTGFMRKLFSQPWQ
ncbi:hypothetical protein XENORESO_019152, partial [Xenotaenia resolanae]